MYCCGKYSLAYQKKPGHLVNFGELVGPETYNFTLSGLKQDILAISIRSSCLLVPNYRCLSVS